MKFLENNKRVVICVLFLFLIFISLGSFFIGTKSINFNAFIKAVLKEGQLSNIIIVWEIRIPRVLVALLIGISLSISGTTYQAIFRNVLADPFILGASAGAAFGAALSIVLGLPHYMLFILAFLSSILAVLLGLFISMKNKEFSVANLILAGLIINGLFNAGLSFLKTIAKIGQLQEITFWLMGGLYNSNWVDVAVLFGTSSFSFLFIYLMKNKLDLLSIGDDVASTTGVNPNLYRVIFLLLSTLITSISVSIGGIIGWVGLMVPHLARKLIGCNHRHLILASAILGGIILIICDDIARVIYEGELPITLITSVLGAPIFIGILRKGGLLYFK